MSKMRRGDNIFTGAATGPIVGPDLPDRETGQRKAEQSTTERIRNSPASTGREFNSIFMTCRVLQLQVQNF
jgi:hypothetical protein